MFLKKVDELEQKDLTTNNKLNGCFNGSGISAYHCH